MWGGHPKTWGQFPERDCLHDTTSPSRTCVCAQLFPTDCSSHLLVSLDINHSSSRGSSFLPLDSCPTRLLPVHLSHFRHIWPRLMHLVRHIHPIPYSSRAWIDLHCTTAKPTSLSLSHTRTKVPAVDRPVICSSWQQREYHTLSFGSIPLHARTHPQAFVTVRISLEVVAPKHTHTIIHGSSRLLYCCRHGRPASTVRNREPSVQQSRILAPGSAISRFPGHRLSIYNPGYHLFFAIPSSSLHYGVSQGVCLK